MCYKKIIFPALGMVTILTMGALGMQTSGTAKSFQPTVVQDSTSTDDGYTIFDTKLIFRKPDVKQTAAYQQQAAAVLRAYEL